MTFAVASRPVVHFAVLAAVFSYLYWTSRRGHFLLWAAGWWALLVRALAFASPGAGARPWAGAGLALVAAVAALVGGLEFAGRHRRPGLASAVGLGAAIGVLAVAAVAGLLAVRPDAVGPVSVAVACLAATWIGSGWLVLRHGRDAAPAGAPTFGLALGAWGVALPVEWALDPAGLAAWFPEVDAALVALVAAGGAILAFEEGRGGPGAVDPSAMRMEESSRLRSEFLSITGHELKTPLTAIIANTEILEYEMMGPVNDEQRRVLTSIGDSAQRLLDMISRLLDYAREGEERDIPRHETVDPRRLIESVVETVRPLLEEGGLRVEVAVDDDLGTVRLDGSRVYRVYLNLVENAIKFSDGGVITVGARRAGDAFEGRVADQGIGIPADRLEEVFDAFRQVDASSTRAYAGVGLGLAICKQLVEAEGGWIGVESILGEGSTFTFRVPLGEEEPEGR